MAEPPALDADRLSAVACAAVGDSSLEVVRWAIEPLAAGAGNPTSDGVFRVSGLASGEGGSRPWSAILKRLRYPREYPAMGEPRMALYWRREVEAYRSGFLDCLPGSVIAPRALLIDEPEPGSAVLWLEDMGSMTSEWRDRERRSAVGHLARLHAAYLTGTSLPGYPWMTMILARQWYDFMMPTVAPAIDAIRGRARHLTALVTLLDDPSAVLNVLESLPQTLCHHDPNPDNVAPRTREDGGGELVVIDWQLVGRGPIGEDVGQFLSGLLSRTAVADRDRLESEVLAAYHAALIAAGVRITVHDVHRGYYCAAALRQGVFAAYLLGERLGSARTREDTRSAVEDFIRHTRHGHLPVLAARARTLSGG